MTFNEWALAHEPTVRLSAFFGVFALMAAWEALAPRRVRLLPRRVRWLHNLALVVLNSLILRLLFPIAAVGFALRAAEHGWGLLNAFEIPFWWAFALSVLALDFVIYLQHVMFHAVPVLWRLHRVHHADADIDVTTGARFHSIEILLSMLIKFAAIAVLGAPAAAVLVFEVLLNATAMFNHANLRLRAPVDRLLRWILVTPEMHRIHHSMEVAETNSNFGFNLPWWDRLCGTYRESARLPQESMAIGVKGLTGSEQAVKLTGLLALPFVNAGGGYAIGSESDSDHEAR
ncbi:MAG: sterol desaturase family protein [Burkholderiales bacterium]|nr:sterol desaturase family protein [Burkholderiales bacterium]